jgi:hypothetical protein
MEAGPGDLARVTGKLADRARLLATKAAAEAPGDSTDPGPVARALAGHPDLAMVALAEELRTLAGDALRLGVQRAHASGHSWAEIGRLLGLSPQAAVQRFGRPPAPPPGEPAPPRITDAADRAITILADWFDERYGAVAATFDATLAGSLTPENLAAARTHLAGTAGPYRRLGDPEPVVRQVGEYTVADVPLVFEAGLMKGRVTFGPAGQVAGLYVLPVGTP